MSWRRNFVAYAMLALAVRIAWNLVAVRLPGEVLSFLHDWTLNYVVTWLFNAGAALLLSPPEARGWWTLWYGAGALAASLLVTVVFFYLVSARLDPFTGFGVSSQVVSVILFVLFLWPVWLVTARPRLKGRQVGA